MIASRLMRLVRILAGAFIGWVAASLALAWALWELAFDYGLVWREEQERTAIAIFIPLGIVVGAIWGARWGKSTDKDASTEPPRFRRSAERFGSQDKHRQTDVTSHALRMAEDVKQSETRLVTRSV
jgi:hypothetical protein